jgi:hypothetical protein
VASKGPEVSLGLRRFSVAGFPVPTSKLPGGLTTLLRIPSDRAKKRWHLHIEADQTVYVCG